MTAAAYIAAPRKQCLHYGVNPLPPTRLRALQRHGRTLDAAYRVACDVAAGFTYADSLAAEDRRAPAMDLSHVDTCLSSYVLDHCNGDHELLLGVPVTLASRMYDVRQVLDSEINGAMCDKPGFDYDAAHRAVAEAFKGVHPLKTFDRRLEPAEPDDDMAESCYAWFRLSWEAPEAEA